MAVVSCIAPDNVLMSVPHNVDFSVFLCTLIFGVFMLSSGGIPDRVG